MRRSGIRTQKMSIPKTGYHMPKQSIKIRKTKVAMLPHDAYNHGRAHVGKKAVGPKLPQGATLL